MKTLLVLLMLPSVLLLPNILQLPSTQAYAISSQDLPQRTGRIVDSANLLSAAHLAQIENRLAEHETQTGEQVVVAIVKSLQGATIEKYSLALANSWRPGSVGINNGVLLVVAPNERKVRIETGLGLEQTLTDTEAHRIIQQRILPSFKENEYAHGVSAGIVGILQTLSGDYDPHWRAPEHKRKSLLQQYFPLLFIAFIAIGHFNRRASGSRRISNAVFPASFFGIAATAVSNQLLLGIGASVVVFTLIYLGSKNKARRGPKDYTSGDYNNGHPSVNHQPYDRQHHYPNQHHENSEDRNRYRDGGHTHSGGGSFGGGGASGSW